mmetsp:Transcript_12764/g.28358  ORF Transcript_12764/g.28358 Transcript_12764/m.28358 type:complete len:227 (-) Transcript_12764:2748-3428(-)
MPLLEDSSPPGELARGSSQNLMCPLPPVTNSSFPPTESVYTSMPLPALPLPSTEPVRVLCTTTVRSSSMPVLTKRSPFALNAILATPRLWNSITRIVTPVLASHSTILGNLPISPVATVCPSGCTSRHRMSSSCSVLCSCLFCCVLNTTPTPAMWYTTSKRLSANDKLLRQSQPLYPYTNFNSSEASGISRWSCLSFQLEGSLTAPFQGFTAPISSPPLGLALNKL